jgi:tripartite ATP-independent transporter DctM subunit
MSIVLTVFILATVIGVPIAFGLAFSAVVYLFVNPSIPMTLIAQRMFTGLDVYPFMAVPFFILAGELMNGAGITKRLVRLADVLVGHMKGGLAHVNIVTSMFFAGITGSAVADTSAIGSMLIPTMDEQGYDTDYSAAVTVSSSVIGPIIPPSIPFVIYALVSGTSVGALFLAGVIPGILLGFGLMLVAWLIARKRNYPRNDRRATLRQMIAALVAAIVPLMMPIIILGGILSGVFTATEASGIAVVYALFVGIVVFRELDVRTLKSIALKTAKTTGVVFVVIAAANIFNWILAVEQVPRQMALLVQGTIDNPIVLLMLINIFLLILGTFVEGTAAIIISVPVLIQITAPFGIHPVTLGAIVVLNLMIGLITPPLGLCLFVVCGITKLKLETVARAVIPFLGIEIVVLLITTYVPWVTLWLPRLFGYIR